MGVRDIALGGLGTTGAYLTLGIPLSKLGMYYYIPITDAEGNWIWGYGLDDAINELIGLALASGKLGVSSDVGLGWLLVHGLIKLSEFYIAIKRIFDITGKPLLTYRPRLTRMGQR